MRIFKSLATAIESERPAKISAEAHDRIVSYVVAVGRLCYRPGFARPAPPAVTIPNTVAGFIGLLSSY